MGILIEDINYALWMLRNGRGFLRSAVLTLALGIGANIAAFTMVNAIIRQPVSLPDPDRLMGIFDDLAGPTGKNINPNALVCVTC